VELNLLQGGSGAKTQIRTVHAMRGHRPYFSVPNEIYQISLTKNKLTPLCCYVKELFYTKFNDYVSLPVVISSLNLPPTCV